MREMTMEDCRRVSYKCHECKMSDEEHEIRLAVMREQLDILTEWLQGKENEDRRHGWRMRKWLKWSLLQKKWNAKLINKFIEFEQIHITLLEKERLKGIESQQKGSIH